MNGSSRHKPSGRKGHGRPATKTTQKDPSLRYAPFGMTTLRRASRERSFDSSATADAPAKDTSERSLTSLRSVRDDDASSRVAGEILRLIRDGRRPCKRYFRE